MTSGGSETSTFGERLRAARGRMSQATLAKRSGVSARAIAGYEAGEYAPGLEVLTKLAVALAVTLDELAGIAGRALPPAPRSIIVLVDEEAWVARPARAVLRDADLERIGRAILGSLATADPRSTRNEPRRGS